jgi:hypothetical protein
MVDIGFVDKAYVFNTTGTASTVLPVPAGVADTHRMLAFVGSAASSPTLAPPAGGSWKLVAEHGPSSSLKTAVFYRDVTAAAEPVSYTWGWSASGRNWGYCCAYSGVDLTQAPLAEPVMYDDVPAATGVQSPALSLLAGDRLVTLAAGRESPGTDEVKDWTNPAGDAERFDFYATTTGTAVKITAGWWDSANAAAPSSARRTLTQSRAMSRVHLWSVRLAAKDAPAGGGGSDGTSGLRMGLPLY